MMKTLKLVLTSVTMFAVLFAGDESRIGTSGGNQVLVPVGARGIALAGSERVYSSGLESIYWNPAGLARAESPTVLASSMDLFNDMGVNYFGASGNFDKLGMLGVTVKSIDMGDIPVTTVEDMDGLGGGTFKGSSSKSIHIFYGSYRYIAHINGLYRNSQHSQLIKISRSAKIIDSHIIE